MVLCTAQSSKGSSQVYSPPVPQQPTFGAPSPFPAPRPQPTAAFSNSPILQNQIPDDEPDVIRYEYGFSSCICANDIDIMQRQWREKRDADMKARSEAAAARREETIRKAERSIDKFYEEYNAKKERNIKENKCVLHGNFTHLLFTDGRYLLTRQQEADFLASFSDSLSAGTTWSRICDYVELQNSQSKTLARNGAGTTDLTRFKEVLLRLKREGEAAPGAAGY